MNKPVKIVCSLKRGCVELSEACTDLDHVTIATVGSDSLSIGAEIEDADALRCAYSLLRDEGLALGLSSGTTVAGAVRVAQALGPGHTVVTILGELAHRYSSKMFSVPFLESRGLPTPDWLRPAARDDVDEALDRVTHGDST